ncbi:MAG: phospholipase D/transphosphatidylase, partial [Chthonomonadales bacterium]|nr:phospholipase D/transphosphatidylase [Chthonomonadales bacterium]
MLSSQLLEAVFQVAETLPQNSLENVATVLETETILSPALRGRVLSIVALSQERALIATLLTVWKQEKASPSPVSVASALRSAAYTQRALRQEEQIDLVWTGPTIGMVWRRTDQALFEVIQAAQKELLLVTFAAYKVPLLIDALRHAIERGVTIRFVAESAEESGGKVQVAPAKAFADIEQYIRFFIWPPEKRSANSYGKTGSLHAKCALADETLLLISSANLTDHAMLLNMEIGLLVNGGPMPRQVKHHFAQLVA